LKGLVDMAKKTDQRTFQARVEQLVEQLKTDIANNIYRNGEFLPSEEALSKQYDLSNRSIRQGLERLAWEGLIEKLPRVGNRVNAKKLLRVVYRDSIYRDIDFDRVLALFHERHPDIEIQLVRTGVFPSYAKGMAPFLEQERVDVMLLNHFDFCDMVQGENLHMLEPLDTQDSVPSYLNNAFQVQGVQYASPFLFSPVVLCYNPNHFQEAGLAEPDSSWTWDDLSKAAANLSEEGQRLGFFYHLLSVNRWLVFLLQNGVRFYHRDDGGFKVDMPLLMESFRLSRDLLFKNNNGMPVYPSEEEGEVIQLYREGRASMFLATYFSLNELLKDNIPFEISPLPRGNSDKTLLLAIGWSVNKLSREKEAATRFVRFLTSPDTQQLIQYSSLSLPAVKLPFDSTLDECHTRRPKRFGLHREIIPSFQLHSELQLPLDRLYTLRNLLKMYWFGVKDDEVIEAEIRMLLEP
jgi:multiple sugar transport system substrate-binding protein